jgi:hypothetical protein
MTTAVQNVAAAQAINARRASKKMITLILKMITQI